MGSLARSSRRIRSYVYRSSVRGISRGTPARSSARRPVCTRRARRRSSPSANRPSRHTERGRHVGPLPIHDVSLQDAGRPLGSRPVARQYFGTDGVRGIVGDFVTAELLEKLGKASALWSGGGRVFVGRDTRASGEELEEAFARGVVSAGGAAVLAGVVPTPAVALLGLDLGVVISASHNPPEYNGVKFFDRNGRKLSDAAEEEIEALLDAPATGGGEADRVGVAVDSYLDHVLERFGTDLNGLRIAVDCANGAYAGLAPRAFEELGAEIATIGDAPNGDNINVGCGATDLAALQELVRSGNFDLGVAFDGDGDRMLAVVERGETVDGDQIVAVLALHLGVDLVAVTTMANLGFHRLMEQRGIRV